MVATVWHDLKWMGAEDPWDPGVFYLDFDWFATAILLSDYPNYSFPPMFVYYVPNEDFIWHIFPYIDFDPVEKYFDPIDGGHPTYGHFVVTTKESFNGEEIHTWYGNTNMFMSQLDMQPVWLLQETGIATLTMFHDQLIGDSYGDFDVLFLLKPGEPSDPWAVCSRKFDFTAEDCLQLAPHPNYVQVSDEGHSSLWSDPLYPDTIFRPPVSADLGDMLGSHECVWVAGPISLPLAYGDYDWWY